MKSVIVVAILDTAQGKCGQLQASDPALGPVFQRVHVAVGQLEPHRPLRNSRASDGVKRRSATRNSLS